NSLTFSLVSGVPSGMTIDSVTGILNWTPTEAQGPSTNVIRVIVTDNGAPALSATNAFTVFVTEVNSAPSLAAIADQTIAEGTLLTVTPSATDADLPANILTFSLDGVVPTGMTINAASGVVSWT